MQFPRIPVPTLLIQFHIYLFLCFSDDLVQLCVDYMKEYPLLVGAGVLLPLLLILAFLWLIRSDDPKTKKPKKKKNKENGASSTSNGSTKKEAKKEK